MKRINYLTIFMVACLVLIVLFAGCNSTQSTTNSTEGSMSDYYTSDYYTKEDFQSITIGESTFRDVYEIAPTESMQVTSYGGFCEYPMPNGGYVRIKFYGKDLIVGDIEEISVPLETD